MNPRIIILAAVLAVVPVEASATSQLNGACDSYLQLYENIQQSLKAGDETKVDRLLSGYMEAEAEVYRNLPAEEAARWDLLSAMTQAIRAVEDSWPDTAYAGFLRMLDSLVLQGHQVQMAAVADSCMRWTQ